MCREEAEVEDFDTNLLCTVLQTLKVSQTCREEAEVEDFDSGTPSPTAAEPEVEDDEPDTARAASIPRSVSIVTRSVSKGLRKATRSAAKSIKETSKRAMSKQSSAVDEEDDKGKTSPWYRLRPGQKKKLSHHSRHIRLIR